MFRTGEPAEAMPRQVKRAWLRLLFGQLQIIGATAGLVLLFQTGVNAWTIGVVAATGVVSIISRLLFRRSPAAQNERKGSP